jgi:uncharacterized RDD family membrane protein YckC
VQYENNFEDNVTVQTPEGVDLSYTLAGLGSRFVGAILDTLIQGGIVFVFLLALGLASGDSESRATVAVAILAVVVFLVVFGYPVLFETLNSGRSPGKMAARMRVVREGGGSVGFIAATVRNVLRLVDILPASYAVGIVAILVTKKNQRIGDLAAGTLVIKDRRLDARPGPGWVATTAPAQPDELAAWDVSAITDQELFTVRSFLARRMELTPESRSALAYDLAARLSPKVAGAAPYRHPEEFLEKLAAAKSARA